VSERDEIIECPCYRICNALGLEMKPWCRYRRSDLPPPGMHRFEPKETWCPPGVQANVLMLAHLLVGKSAGVEEAQQILANITSWAHNLPLPEGVE